ncbi:MAG TPA: nitroreductase family protein [Anaerolineaceae bacterium]|nr:nitroreductase family protein [Anaerolineaceae bacterium]
MKCSDLNPHDYRFAEHPIESSILKRWSPRAMTGEVVDKKLLMSLFEAARWAPSSGNVQNWHYFYALKPSTEFDLFFSFLDPGNQEWCVKAAALLVVVDQTVNAAGRPIGPHAFNVGLSVQNLLLQGWAMGILVHPMGGFSADAAKVSLNLPETWQPVVMIAIGNFGEVCELSEKNRNREFPSARKQLVEFVHEGPLQPEN